MGRAWKPHIEKPCPSWESNPGHFCYDATVLTTKSLWQSALKVRQLDVLFSTVTIQRQADSDLETLLTFT